MKKLPTYALCAFLAFAPMTSCTTPLPAPQGNAMIQEIELQKAEGKISEETANFMIAQIKKQMSEDPGIDWDAVLKVGGGVASAVLASLTGIHFMPSRSGVKKSQAQLLQEMLDRFARERALAEKAEQDAVADATLKGIEGAAPPA